MRKYRDSEGDVWEEQPDGDYLLVVEDCENWLPFSLLEQIWGPLSEVID